MIGLPGISSALSHWQDYFVVINKFIFNLEINVNDHRLTNGKPKRFKRCIPLTTKEPNLEYNFDGVNAMLSFKSKANPIYAHNNKVVIYIASYFFITPTVLSPLLFTRYNSPYSLQLYVPVIYVCLHSASTKCYFNNTNTYCFSSSPSCCYSLPDISTTHAHTRDRNVSSS